MKIVCDNCSAKYQISDDKVRNKTFKIRCKKCSHVIVVRGGQGTADEQEPEAAAPDAEAPAAAVAASAGDPEAVWHVVINRENVGPLTAAQVEAYFNNGDVDGESFTWAEGMTDWSKLSAVPQFAHLAPAPAAPVAAAAPAAAAAAVAAGGMEEDATRQQTPSSMFPSEDDDVIASNNVADPAPAAGLGSGGMFPEEPVSPRVSTAAQLRNQRNENSVLFSLDSLAADVESSNRPKVSNTGGSEASGLIDISALSSLGGPAPGGDDPFGSSGMAPAPLTGAAPVQPLVAPSSGSNTGLVVALVVIILLLLGGGGAVAWFVMQDDEKPEKPEVAASDTPTKVSVGGPTEAEKAAAQQAAIEKAVAERLAAEKAAEKGKDAGTEDGADDGEDDGEKVASAKPKAGRRARSRRGASKPAASKPASPKPEASKPAARKPAAKKESTSEVDDLLGALDGSGGGSKSRAAAPAAAAPAASGDPLLPEKLTRRQILTVVKRNARSITTCKEGTDASGTVTSATVKSGPQKGTPVGSCIERKVRAFRFPQFSGDPMRIVMPFAL